jgi:hypothetical protein
VPDAGPIFVVGPSRSGTTLVRGILNAHSAVSIAAETHYFDDIRARLGEKARQPLAPSDAEAVERYFLALGDKVYGQEGDPSASTLDVERLRAEARDRGGTADSYFEAFCVLRMRELDRSRWGEKTPRHVFRIDEMLDAWPDAQVVCLVRDPRAVVASYRDWKRGKPASTSADRKRAVRSYNIVVNALLWKGAMEASQQAVSRHGPGRVQLVRYEELVSEPEATLRRLTDWLGIAYEESMLDVPVTRSSYDDAAHGISQAPLERWREKLTPTEISVVQTCCGGVMARLGYAKEKVEAPLHSLALTWAHVPIGVARAGFANRKRLGNVSEYVRKRLRLALSRGG